MTTERLTGLSLSLLQIHHDIPVDLEVAIDELCRRHPRRMQMVEILEDRLIYNFLFTLSSLLRADKVGVASLKWAWTKICARLRVHEIIMPLPAPPCCIS